MLPVIISEYSLDTGIEKKNKKNTPDEQTRK